jgi:hypothetical protein
LPLGDAFSGECRASESAVQPDETRMRNVCNFGFGRHGCEQFPLSSTADAIRFHAASDSGELVKIQYVFENDCWPGERGDATSLTSEVLRRQADVFLENYLRRRNAT